LVESDGSGVEGIDRIAVVPHAKMFKGRNTGNDRKTLFERVRKAKKVANEDTVRIVRVFIPIETCGVGMLGKYLTMCGTHIE
jgi:hypothetical protein